MEPPNEEEDIQPPDKDYYIFEIPYYATFVYYGTIAEARAFFKSVKNREKHGTMRLANPNNQKDKDLVMRELENIKKDRKAGIPGLPRYPSKEWL